MALSPTSSRSSGGSAAPITRAQYDLALTNVAAGITKMPFVFNYGDAILNLTSATNPTPVVSGTYSFAVTVSTTTLIEDKAWGILVTLDEDDFAASIGFSVEQTGANGQQALTFPFYVPAGSPCYVQVNHADTNPVSFSGHAFVQRLS